MEEGNDIFFRYGEMVREAVDCCSFFCNRRVNGHDWQSNQSHNTKLLMRKPGYKKSRVFFINRGLFLNASNAACQWL
jgi:hypothetical protein